MSTVPPPENDPARRPSLASVDDALYGPRDDLPSHNWGWFALRGVAMLVLGALAILFPAPALFVFAAVFAAYSFFDGVLALISGVRRARHDQPRWWPLALSGILGILVGVVFFFFPALGTIAYAVTFIAVVAAWAIVQGVLMIVAAWRMRRIIDREWLLVASGVLSVVLALALLALLAITPRITILSVAWVIGIWAFISAALMLMLAFRLRRHRDESMVIEAGPAG